MPGYNTDEQDWGWKGVKGQVTLAEYMQQRQDHVEAGCFGCCCKNCLYWWSQRCPYGKCFDDLRAQQDPYDQAHPDQPPRKWWSNWDKPGEQAHWCRGGTFYPTYTCNHFVKYKGQQVKTCLKCNVSVFQDGYIDCSLVDALGCEKCYAEFYEKMEGEY